MSVRADPLTVDARASAEHVIGGGPDLGCTYAAAAADDPHLPWRARSLVGWLQGEQREDGGFAPAGDSERACLTATYQALATLDALGARPQDQVACARWVLARRGRQGSFVRWEGYLRWPVPPLALV